jgi:hypothetical protein
MKKRSFARLRMTKAEAHYDLLFSLILLFFVILNGAPRSEETILRKRDPSLRLRMTKAWE